MNTIQFCKQAGIKELLMKLLVNSSKTGIPSLSRLKKLDAASALPGAAKAYFKAHPAQSIAGTGAAISAPFAIPALRDMAEAGRAATKFTEDLTGATFGSGEDPGILQQLVGKGGFNRATGQDLPPGVIPQLKDTIRDIKLQSVGAIKDIGNASSTVDQLLQNPYMKWGLIGSTAATIPYLGYKAYESDRKSRAMNRILEKLR